MHFTILYKALPSQLPNCVMRNCQALATAIGYYYPEAQIKLAYSVPDSAELISVPMAGLLWFKYWLSKPLQIVTEPIFDLAYFGLDEPNEMLSLFVSRNLKTVSYGNGTDSAGLSLHKCGSALGAGDLARAYALTKAVLIVRPGLSNQLAEAVAYGKPVVGCVGSGLGAELMARLASDVKQIVANEQAQKSLAESVYSQVLNCRLRQDMLGTWGEANVVLWPV